MNQATTGARGKRPLPGFGWVWLSLDAALTAHLRPAEGVNSLFKSVIRLRSSNYKRISSLVNLFDRLRPGLAESAAHRLMQVNHFPLAGYQMTLLAYGSGATVFLLEKGQDKRVLKVFRRSLGKSARRAWEVAREFQEKHQSLVRWFNEPGEGDPTDPVVLPSQFLVLHSPLMGVTAGAILQPYLPGKKCDLFLDYSIQEILQICEVNQQLRRQLLDFSAQLFKVLAETGRCFDLVGRENLMLVETNGELRLKIADNGIFNVEQIRVNSPALYDRLQSHLQQLQLIREGLERR